MIFPFVKFATTIGALTAYFACFRANFHLIILKLI